MACQVTVLAKITYIKILSYSLKGRMECVGSQTRSRSMLPNFGCAKSEGKLLLFFFSMIRNPVNLDQNPHAILRMSGFQKWVLLYSLQLTSTGARGTD